MLEVKPRVPFKENNSLVINKPRYLIAYRKHLKKIIIKISI